MWIKIVAWAIAIIFALLGWWLRQKASKDLSHERPEEDVMTSFASGMSQYEEMLGWALIAIGIATMVVLLIISDSPS